jgi:hypothetical protein
LIFFEGTIMKFLGKLTVILAIAIFSTQLLAAEGDDNDYGDDDMQTSDDMMDTNSDISSNPYNPGLQPDSSSNPGLQPGASTNPGLQPEGQ